MAVKLYSRAKRELRKLPPKAQEIIKPVLLQMDKDISKLDVVKLGGTDNLYRVHATRNYVIIYAKDNGDILVARIADRKEVYKDLKTLRKIIKKLTK